MCIPFNYQPKLVGTLHKWLGPNDIHGKLAMHSFSWLMGGSTTTNGIVFDNGARFFISFHDPDRIRQIVRTILEDPVMFEGLIVTDVSIQPDPDLSNCEFFKIGSRFLFKDGWKTGAINITPMRILLQEIYWRKR